jgi:hypothetical protein
MGSEIEVIEKPSEVKLYEAMRSAISICHAIDEVQEIADKAGGLAAYYKQIKDDESERKFLQIKLRAWRQIGKLFFERIDAFGFATMAEGARMVRAAFPDDATVREMPDHRVIQALKIASPEITDEFFDANVAGCRSIDVFLSVYQRSTPQGQEEIARLERAREEYEARRAEREVEDKKANAARLAEEQAEIREFIAFKAARDEAASEVGITLERKDREHMKQVVFLLRDTVHESMRKAAFDKRITMQAILRQGLAMWFIANGYDVPISEMDLKPKK